MVRVLLVGDVHGNDKFFKAACKWAARRGIEGIVQLGDFGYWEHYDSGARFLDTCERNLKDFDLWAWWLDGNHENHMRLYRDYPVDLETGRRPVRERLDHLPRGHTWEWDGLKYVAMGGGYSIDKEWRLADYGIGTADTGAWWSTELISDEELDQALAVTQDGFDVLLSHDCPWGVDIPSLREHHKNIFPSSQANREKLLELCNVGKPSLVAHGHYHCRYESRLDYGSGSARVWGLAADFECDERAWRLLDTSKLGESASR